MSTIFFSSRRNNVVVKIFLHRFYWPQNLYHPKLESMCLLKSATSMCLLHTYYAFLESRKSRRRKTKWLSALMLLEQRSLFLPISFCKKGELTVICQLVTSVTNVTMWANGRHIGDTDESPFSAILYSLGWALLFKIGPTLLFIDKRDGITQLGALETTK